MGCRLCRCCCRKRARNRYPTCPSVYFRQLNGKLTKGQIQHLYNRFCKFSGEMKPDEPPPTHLYKYNFYNGSVHLNPLLPTILNCMFGTKNALSFVEFASFLSIFQANTLKTTNEEKNENAQKKLQILFSMYDRNKDGLISKSDIVAVVHKLFSNSLEPRKIMHIVKTMMEEMDSEGTQQIQFADFERSFEIFDMSEMLVCNIPDYIDK